MRIFHFKLRHCFLLVRNTSSSSPFCARRALARRLHLYSQNVAKRVSRPGNSVIFILYLYFSHQPRWNLSISTCSVHQVLQIDPKTWWREAFFFFLLQKSLMLFIDSLRQSFLQYCWSPFGFWNTHLHWILMTSSNSVHWAL